MLAASSNQMLCRAIPCRRSAAARRRMTTAAMWWRRCSRSMGVSPMHFQISNAWAGRPCYGKSGIARENSDLHENLEHIHQRHDQPDQEDLEHGREEGHVLIRRDERHVRSEMRDPIARLLNAGDV